MIYQKQQALQIKSLGIGETMQVHKVEGNRIRALLSYYKRFNNKIYSCKELTKNNLTITRKK
jgi:hypothetical protein